VHRVENWKTQNRFPTFPPGTRDDNDGSFSEPQNQRKEVGRYAASYPDLSPVDRNRDFMLILQLENADSPARP
jgi:hypothetical protein